MADEPKPEREPYIYRCDRHSYVLETRAPPIQSGLKIFCPLCKDEFLAKHLSVLQNSNPNAGKFRKQ